VPTSVVGVNSNVRHHMHALLRTTILSLLIVCSGATFSQSPTGGSESPQQQIASTNGDPSWRPSVAQLHAIETVTRSYFALRDSGKAEQAYALLSPRQKQYLTQANFTQLLEGFNSTAGAPQGRILRKVTWYRDTPQSGPGLYVAVDFSSKFENLALHCGYVVWHEQPDGSFLQVREEMNVIDNATMAKLKPEQLESIRAQFRC
jgi:Protein of unknown function (DUF4019)